MRVPVVLWGSGLGWTPSWGELAVPSARKPASKRQRATASNPNSGSKAATSQYKRSIGSTLWQQLVSLRKSSPVHTTLSFLKTFTIGVARYLSAFQRFAGRWSQNGFRSDRWRRQTIEPETKIRVYIHILSHAYIYIHIYTYIHIYIHVT